MEDTGRALEWRTQVGHWYGEHRCQVGHWYGGHRQGIGMGDTCRALLWGDR